MKHKRPAAVNIGIDIDPDVINFWSAADTTKMAVGYRANSRSPIAENTDSRSHIYENSGGIRPASSEISSGDDQYFTAINADASEWLKDYPFTGNEFVYADPLCIKAVTENDTKKNGKSWGKLKFRKRWLRQPPCLA